ncbi:MAG: LytTR family DNA-binding domain-containing protein [Eubacterium sp.]|nr:LytTR family DNA-binding domain-containing protein [Eubacterium sp.]
MFRIAICDDETYFRENIKNRLEDYFKNKKYTVEIQCFEDGRALLKANTESPFDLAFLDIEMPKLDGVTLGERLREQHKDIFIIFITAHDSYVPAAFRLGAFQYLKKPVEDTFFTEEMDRVTTAYVLRSQDYTFDYDGVKNQIPLSEIRYLESSRWNVLIHTGQEVFKIVSTLGKEAARLEGRCFLRIHQSYLVNMKYVRQFRSDRVLLWCNQNTELPVGRKYKDEARRVFLTYQSEVGI